MKGFKRFMGVALAATMVVGSGVIAFAADSATSGSTTGTGTSEGHVDKHIINVVLPTVAEGSTPFAYTMDVERLIQDTNGGKYDNAVFPEEESDTGVYFLAGTDESGKTTYANTSETLKVISKSSADVKLTVEVEVASAATDIKLVNTAPANTVTDPELYLALLVGSETPAAIQKDAKASVEVTLAGKDDNFETTVDENKKYVYAEKSGDLTWSETTISLTGAVSKASAEGLTAPALTVTWKYEDPAAEPETVEGGIFYLNDTGDWWIGLSEEQGFTKGITLGSVTINGQTIPGTVREYEGEDWVVVTWSDYVAAGYDQTVTTYDFVAVVNGIQYTATHIYQ